MNPTTPPQGAQPSQWEGVTLIVLWFAGTLSWWVLAFPPLDSQPPDWLARLQAVCFGTGGDGAPALYGWFSLAGGPLGTLAVMAAGWWPEVSRGLRHLLRDAAGRLVLGGLVVALAAETGWAGWRMLERNRPSAPVSLAATADGGPLSEDPARQGKPLPLFSLTDQQGRRFTPAQLPGRVTFLTFAYGNCATVCPLVLKRITTALESGAPQETRVVVITLDAWRDRPSRLEAIRRQWNLPDTARVLSGEILAVNRLLDQMEIYRRRDERTGEIDHLAWVYVLGPDGRVAHALVNPSARQLAEAGRQAASS